MASGMTLETLRVMIRAETKPFRDELGKMQQDLKRATRSVENETSKIKRAFGGIKGKMVGLGIGTGLFKIGKDSIKFASNLQEVQNVVDVAFGDMSYKIENFSKNAIKQFGMSELSAKQTAGTFMAMGRGIGLAAKPASNMAIELSKLSGDVASFFNISQSEAAIKLQSVFTGETETLKQLGVVMTQTNLKQYAMDHGLNSNIESMDQASLTMLRYMFVMDSLKLAQGDFARTSGTWANQIRILQEQWKQLTGIIGDGLIAMFTPVIHVINVVLEKLIYFAQVVSAVFSSLFGKKSKDTNKGTKQMQQSLGGAETSAGGLNNQLDKTEGKAKKAAKAMGQLASIDEINNMSKPSDASSPVGGGVSSIPSIFGNEDEDKDDPDTSGIDRAVEKVKAKLNEFKKFLEKYKAPITSIAAGIAAALASMFIIKNWPALIAPFKSFFGNLSAMFGLFKSAGFAETISGLFFGISTPALAAVGIIAAVVASLVYLWQTNDEFRKNVMDVVHSITDILNEFYNTVLVPLFELLKDIFETIVIPIAVFLADVVVTAVELVADVVMAFWKNILAPIAEFLVKILSKALDGVIKIWEAWKPAIEIAFGAVGHIWNDILKPFFTWIKDGLIKRFEELGAFIAELLPNIEDMFQGLINFFVDVFTLNLDNIWNDITEIFKGFDDFLTNIFKHDWSENFGVIGKVINEFLDVVKVVWDGAKKVFKGVIDFVMGIFTGDWKRAWNGVKNIFKGVWDSLVGIVDNVWNRILKLFKKGGQIFSGIVEGISKVFKTIVNTLITGINKVMAWPFNKINDMLNSIRNFEILGQHPFSGLWGQNPIWVPQIPMLARGGVVTSATPAIFGEAGAEAVVPLENNTGWMAKIAQGIAGHVGGGYNDDLNDLIMIMQEVRDLLIELKDKDNDVYLDGEKVTDNINRLNRYRKLRTG